MLSRQLAMERDRSRLSVGQSSDNLRAKMLAAEASDANIQPQVAPTSEPTEDDINADPQSHFLSPIHFYETWDSDSEPDDADPYELDAGITDFSLFHSDYKRAQETHQPLPSKWHDFLQDQSQAYHRLGEAEQPPAFLSQSPGAELPTPGLTPDTSPRLKDDMDYEPDTTSPSPPYRTVIVEPTSPIDIPKRSFSFPSLSFSPDSAITEEDEDEDAEEGLTFSLFTQRARHSAARNVRAYGRPGQAVKPGMRGLRTLSGKAHVWRRPSWDLWPVEEEEVGWTEDGEMEGMMEGSGVEMARGRRSE